jgi:membrane protein
VLGRGAAHAEMNRVLHDAVGARGASAIDEWVMGASKGGEVAGVVGVGLMLVAASKLGTRLREALNQIWDVGADALIPSVGLYVRRRLLAFSLVLLGGLTLLAIAASRTVLTALHEVLFGASPRLGLLIQVLQIGLSLAIAAGVFAVIFRYLPDEHVRWKIAGIGGALTSVLFNVGNALVGLYLGRATSAAAYGAAGSVLVVLLWLYFSAHMFLIGAEFTQVYARGWGVEPRPSAPREWRRPRARKPRAISAARARGHGI